MPDRHIPAPAGWPAGPQARRPGGPGRYGFGPLDSAEAAFRLLTTGPRQGGG